MIHLTKLFYIYRGSQSLLSIMHEKGKSNSLEFSVLLLAAFRTRCLSHFWYKHTNLTQTLKHPQPDTSFILFPQFACGVDTPWNHRPMHSHAFIQHPKAGSPATLQLQPMHCHSSGADLEHSHSLIWEVSEFNHASCTKPWQLIQFLEMKTWDWVSHSSCINSFPAISDEKSGSTSTPFISPRTPFSSLWGHKLEQCSHNERKTMFLM